MSSRGEGASRAEPGAGVAARVAALRALVRVERDDVWATTAVHGELDRGDLDREDRALVSSLAYETLRWQGTLDWALGHASRRPIERLDPEVRAALRLGAWQLLRGRQHDGAAVSTAVEAVRTVAGQRVTGFVNGVLRGLARRRETLPWPDPGTDAGMALRHGYPEWVARAARARFADRAEAVLAAGNASPGVTLRATGGPPARDALVAELADAGVDAGPAELAPESVRAAGADPSRLAAVTEGRAVVQDEASTLAGRAAAEDAPAGARAADVCAAPGGKSTHLAEQGLWVVAADRHVARVQAMARSFGAHPNRPVLQPLAADAAAPPLRAGSFEVVLVDAPCTGLGVVRRRPELRWRLAPSDPAELAARQVALLRAAAGLVAAGGRLCYGVCTWTLAETVGVADDVVADLADRFDVVRPAALADAAPPLTGPRGPDPGVQLAPDRHDVDGMYVLTLVRR